MEPIKRIAILLFVLVNALSLFATGSEQRLDSIVTFSAEKGYTKYAYTYNEKGLRSKYTHYTRDNLENGVGDNIWKNSLFYEYNYDEKGNCIELISYKYENSTSNDPIKENRITYEYNENNNPTIEIHSEWNSISQNWNPTIQYVNEYDASNRQYSNAIYQRNENGTAWECVIKNVDAYDETEHTHSLESYIGEGANWIGERKRVNYLDEKENVISYISYTWDETYKLWNNEKKADYRYNNDLLQSFTQYDWNQNAWEQETQATLEYDENRKIKSYVKYTWDANYGWVVDTKSKFDYTYDNQGNSLSEKEYLWNDKLSDWEIRLENRHTYDENNNEISNDLFEWNKRVNKLIPIGSYEKAYDTANNELVYTHHGIDSSKGAYVGKEKVEKEYDSENNVLSRTFYKWNLEEQKWEPNIQIQSIYNRHNNRVTEEYYSWKSSSWKLNNYKIFYYTSEQQEVLVDYKKCAVPFTTCSLSLYLENLTNLAFNSSFVLNLPEGFTLDRENTILAPELADDYDLVISTKDTGKEYFTITPQSDGNAGSTEYQYLIDIQFNISELLPEGTYKLSINDLELRFANQTVVTEDELTVNVYIDMCTIEKIHETQAISNVYIIDNTLYVDSNRKETVSIYTIKGFLIHNGEKDEGLFTLDVSNLQNEIIIVNGSLSGVKKLIK